MGLKYVDPNDLDRLRTADGDPLPKGYDQHTVIAQIARAVFDNFPPGFYFVVAMTGIILVLAANTAFNGFPVLGSILAKDGFMPRQLGSRGDRLAYSNGIVILALMAIVLIIAFNAEPTRLIQLYIVGVFVSFNLSQLGMIRHWTRHLKTETDPAAAAADVPLPGDQHLRPRDDRGGVRDRAAHQVPGRRLDRDPGDDRLLRDHEVDPPPLRQRRRRARDRGPGPGAADPGARDRAGLQGAQADDAGAGLRQGDPAQRARGGHGRHRRRTHRPGPRRVGRAADRRTAEGALLAVPRDHPPGRRLRAQHPRRQPARRGRGLHPRVRRRPLVGAAAAQPDRAAAQGPAAVHAGRHGDLGALPAPLGDLRQAARRPAAHEGAARRRPPRPGAQPAAARHDQDDK